MTAKASKKKTKLADATKVFDITRPHKATASAAIVTGHKLLDTDPPQADEPVTDAAPAAMAHHKTIQPPPPPADIIETTDDPATPPPNQPAMSQPSPPEPPANPMPPANEPQPEPDPPSPEAPPQPTFNGPETEQLIASKAYMVPLGTTKTRSVWISLVVLLIIFGLGAALAIVLSQSLSI